MIFIIGKRSNLSKELLKVLKNVVLVSSLSELKNSFTNLDKNELHIKIIFNNFQASSMLYSDSNLDKYVENSILHTSQILTYLDMENIVIDKIIYTSSSAVYGNNELCSEDSQVKPMSLQAALKVANEELIKRFCISRNISYIITRIFNMYGGDDNFSVIYKIKNAYLNNEVLTIINQGESIRDYIHVNDVVNIYNKILYMDSTPFNILNIATGNGTKVSSIITKLEAKGINIGLLNIDRSEIKISIANISKLSTIIDTKVLISVDFFLIKELKNENYN